jgi:outer membrane protein TolC
MDWGARKAEVERSRALYVEQLAAFSQAYLKAIEDVENTLYQERKQREFLEGLERRRHFWPAPSKRPGIDTPTA